MVFYIPDLFTPYVQGREAAIDRNWKDMTQYNQVQQGQLENMKRVGTLNADINKPYQDLYELWLKNQFNTELYPSSVQAAQAQNAQKLLDFDVYRAGQAGREAQAMAYSDALQKYIGQIANSQGEAAALQALIQVMQGQQYAGWLGLPATRGGFIDFWNRGLSGLPGAPVASPTGQGNAAQPAPLIRQTPEDEAAMQPKSSTTPNAQGAPVTSTPQAGASQTQGRGTQTIFDNATSRGWSLEMPQGANPGDYNMVPMLDETGGTVYMYQLKPEVAQRRALLEQSRNPRLF